MSWFLLVFICRGLSTNLALVQQLAEIQRGGSPLQIKIHSWFFSFIEMPCTQCSVRVQNSDLNIPQRCLLRNSNNRVRTESFLANHSEAASFYRQLVVNAWTLQHHRQKNNLKTSTYGGVQQTFGNMFLVTVFKLFIGLASSHSE